MDPIDTLITSAIQYEIGLNNNPFITQETIILRLYNKIAERTNVLPYENEKTQLFATWHDTVLETYYAIRSALSQDEKTCVERVLSRDSPLVTELIKFANCWYKYNSHGACKLFAVDGLLGPHPKSYANEAFSPQFQKHNNAVRALYAYFTDPETIQKIIEKALFLCDGDPCGPDIDPDFERCVALYAEMAGDTKSLINERKNKIQPVVKRKKPPHQRDNAVSK